MSSKSKTTSKKYLDETILVLLILYIMEKSYSIIADYIKISKLKVTQKIQHALKNPNIPYCKTK